MVESNRYDVRFCEECDDPFVPGRISQVLCRSNECRRRRNRKISKASKARIGSNHERTKKEFLDQLRRQDGHCYLCPSRRTLVWDHDHSCCKSSRRKCCRRKILCQRCNHGIFLLEGYDVDWLESAVDYLAEHSLTVTSVSGILEG